MAKIDWIIHYCANGVVCAECKKVETGFLKNTCNAHTHGMGKYHHMDFQIVLSLPLEEIGRILNTLGLRVQAGERFRDGDLVSGIYEDCDIRLNEYEETRYGKDKRDGRIDIALQGPRQLEQAGIRGRRQALCGC